MISKIGLLSTFFALNFIDMLQTIPLLNAGLESNPFARSYPHIWFPFKFIFTLGFSVGLYWLDVNIEKRDVGRFRDFIRSLLSLMYILIIVADLFYLSIVLRNMSTLGRLF